MGSDLSGIAGPMKYPTETFTRSTDLQYTNMAQKKQQNDNSGMILPWGDRYKHRGMSWTENGVMAVALYAAERKPFAVDF